MLVSWSKVPEVASNAAHTHSSTIEVSGTRERGLKVPKVLKNRPSRALAQATRARVRIVPFREPMVDSRKMSAATGAARAPRKVCTARVATEGASGQAVELALATCANGRA